MSGSADSTFDIAVLSNDSDPDGDTLVLASCWSSFQGVSVTISGNECVYEHYDPGSWWWPDMFFYTISDGNGGTDIALVTVTPS